MEGKGTTGRIGISADSSCEELTSIDAAISQISYKMGRKNRFYVV